MHIIPNFMLMSSIMYGWHKLLNKKIEFKNPRLYITLIGMMIISIINFIVMDKIIRVAILTIVFAFFIKFLFKQNIQKTVMTAIFHQVIIFISEFIPFLLMDIFIDTNKTIAFLESFMGIYVMNFTVAVVAMCIVNIKFVKKIYNKIINITNKINMNQLMIICLITMLFFNIFAKNVYYKLDFKYWVIANIIFIVVLFVVMLFSLKAQNNLNKVSDKYNIAIKSLNDFEEMMSKYRVANHENKNLLLTVRAMIVNKEKDIPNYIDSLIEDKYKDDEKLMLNMAVIPSGGLRATIYSSIMKIKENKINYDLIIDKKIRSTDLIELDTNTIIDVCKIIGVFIDNAIDETNKLKKKEIVINLFVENNKLNIKISNSFKDKINLDKIYDEGYTTKTKGHGYGLVLVKEIIKNNDLLENHTEINKQVFSQILSIKAKK